MGQFSAEIYAFPGSLLDGNQHLHTDRQNGGSYRNLTIEADPVAYIERGDA